MDKIINGVICNRTIYGVLKQSKKFAGHSKWANIKRAKESNDSAKAHMFKMLSRRIKIAITEGGSAIPADNTKLAQIIAQAKKANMPLAAIAKVLEKAEKTASESFVLEVKGPGGSNILVTVYTDNIYTTKNLIRGISRRHGGQLVDNTLLKLFDYKGVVVTEIKGDLDSATEDAIKAEAEDVEEITVDDTKYYQFMCESKLLQRMYSLLEDLGYTIVSSDEEYIPQLYANLTEAEKELVEKMYAKLYLVEGVYRIFDNIV